MQPSSSYETNGSPSIQYILPSPFTDFMIMFSTAQIWTLSRIRCTQSTSSNTISL